MKLQRRALAALVMGSALTWLSGSVLAQSAYPNKPIRIVVSFPPGGPTDNTVRIISQRLGDIMGQPVVIENRAGAGGNVGTQSVARAAPDGYTFLASSSAFAVNPSMYAGKAGYDPIKDFVPVITISTQPNVISVNEKVPVKTLAELQSHAKRAKLSFASPGSGTTPHLTCENTFRVKWNSDIIHVPYRGAGPASVAVVAGDTPIACTAAFGVLQFHQQGKVRILAVSSDRRLPQLPEVPTFVESGYPDIMDYTWTTLFAPVGTSPAIIERVNAAINQILKTQEFLDRFEKGGLIPVGGSVADTSAYIAKEVNRWAQIVKLTGAKAE